MERAHGAADGTDAVHVRGGRGSDSVRLDADGEALGFTVMLVGIGFLLGCLSLYNKPFEEPRTKKTK